MSANKRNETTEIERVLEKAARDIARQNAELREVIAESDMDLTALAKVAAFQPTVTKRSATLRFIGTRG